MNSAASATIEISNPGYEELIRFARALYSGAGVYRGMSEVALIEKPEPGHEQFALTAVLKDIMRKSLWKFIIDSGGSRKIEVLAGEEPVLARIWDRFAAPDNPLKITKTSLEILLELYDCCRSRHFASIPEKLARRNFVCWGDALLLHIAVLALIKEQGINLKDSLVSSLITVSPLTNITHYAFADEPPVNLDFIKDGEGPLYFWYFFDHILKNWLEIERQKPKLPIARLKEILARQTELFEKLFDAFAPESPSGEECEAAPHLLQLIMRFYGAVIERAGNAETVLAGIEEKAGELNSIREKDNYRRLWASVFEPCRRLEELNMAIADRAGRLEATPSEQFFSKCYHAFAGKYGKEVLALVSALRGEVG
ncbi:MAG: hypothetical protein ACYS8W_12095 [Planctomycetota bacterium]